MTLVDSNGKNPLVGSLLIFGFLAAGLVATSAGYSSTLLVPMLCAAAGVTALWCRQQSRQHREKYLALQALHGSEARYRTVVDSANDAIVTINATGEIAGWNGAAEKIFRYPPVEVMGPPLASIM